MAKRRTGRLAVLEELRRLKAVPMWADARAIGFGAGVAHLRDVPRRIREARERGYAVACRRIPGTYRYEYLLEREPGEEKPRQRSKPEGAPITGALHYSLMSGDADYAADRLAGMVRSLRQNQQHRLAEKINRVVAVLRHVEGETL